MKGPPAATVDPVQAARAGKNIRTPAAFAAVAGRIVLLPNAVGRPDAVSCAARVAFDGRQSFHLPLDVPYPLGSPTAFGFEVVAPDGRVAAAGQAWAGAGRRRALQVAAAAPLVGPHAVVLRTRLAGPGRTAWTHAHVLACVAAPAGWESDIGHGHPPEVPVAAAAARSGTVSCSSCGGQSVGRALGGRNSRPGTPPMCLICGSLERHRVIRAVVEALPADRLIAARLLQFGPVSVVQAPAFRSFEVSIYGGHNSLDLLNIARPAARYDWVLANHVLEHVGDDGRAVTELQRILAPDGIAEVTVPDTYWQFATSDWGFADPDRNEHFRKCGSDFPRVIGQKVPDCRIAQVVGQDPVTRIRGIVYLTSRTLPPLEAVGRTCLSAGMIVTCAWVALPRGRLGPFGHGAVRGQGFCRMPKGCAS